MPRCGLRSGDAALRWCCGRSGGAGVHSMVLTVLRVVVIVNADHWLARHLLRTLKERCSRW